MTAELRCRLEIAKLAGDVAAEASLALHAEFEGVRDAHRALFEEVEKMGPVLLQALALLVEEMNRRGTDDRVLRVAWTALAGNGSAVHGN